MPIPGEALISKLWETLADKAIGNLLKPWQIRREGRAHLDVKRDELLVIAQAERDAEAIRRGEIRLTAYRIMEPTILLPAPKELGAPNVNNEPPAHPAPATEKAALENIASATQADALRREVNIAKAILHAEESLESDTDVPPNETPTDDWMYRWRDYAASVSSEELQLLWGRVLAGEVKTPGAYSVRFLSFLHNLDKDEAQLIAQAMPFVIEDFIFSKANELLEKVGLPFGKLLALQELGLITGVEGRGLSKQYSAQPGKQFRMLIRNYSLAIGFIANKDVTTLEIPAYVVTTVGRQLTRLGNFQPNPEYLQFVGEFIKDKGFDVLLGTPLDRLDGTTTLIDPKAL